MKGEKQANKSVVRSGEVKKRNASTLAKKRLKRWMGLFLNKKKTVSLYKISVTLKPVTTDSSGQEQLIFEKKVTAKCIQ
ncbi:SH3 and PX domain-containing protein 2A [Trichinella spiralis]|uniref:SH3 and PX domain-containing protein 2A n=1 Tax=Trichinella spiralis TaxID=6334 RepID=A0ABR3KTP1_TRISP